MILNMMQQTQSSAFHWSKTQTVDALDIVCFIYALSLAI